MNVYGQLLAVGTEIDSITFSPVDTTIGWGGIRFFNTNENSLDSSKILFCSFKNGKAILGEDEHLSGGAIYIENSSRLEIGYSLFYRNLAFGGSDFGGGAIYAKDSQILIHHCLFNQNKAVNNDGGAILSNGCDIDIRHTDFLNNEANSWGGAICTYLKYFEPTHYILKYLNITNNKAHIGGGIYLGRNATTESSAIGILDFSLSTVNGNRALEGGGIYSYLYGKQDIPIRNVQFSGNSAGHWGSAATFDSHGYFQNCIFDHNFCHNTIDDEGFTIHLEFGRAQFINCVLADNLDKKGVIGGYSYDTWDANIVNSIIWHNASGINANEYYNDVDVVYSSVQYPWSNLDLGPGVKHIDPEFRNREERDYHLSTSSPVIDLGDPDAFFNDFAMGYNAGRGTRRNDMGAYGGKLNAWTERPIANFIADNLHGKAPLEVHFTNLSLNDPLEFAWDFNNDGEFDSFEQNPTYIYEEPGVYSVKLIVNSYEIADTLVLNEYITVRSDTYIGEVSGIWDIDTVKIIGNIYIPEDSTLTIMPGTNIYFTGNYKFDIFGTLLAEGTETDSIFFFSDSLGYANWNYVGVWGGLTFHSTTINNQEQSTIKYCNFKYVNGRGIALYESNIEIENTKIDSCVGESGSQDAGIFAQQSDIVVKNSLISNSSPYGVCIENSTLDFISSISTKKRNWNHFV